MGSTVSFGTNSKVRSVCMCVCVCVYVCVALHLKIFKTIINKVFLSIINEDGLTNAAFLLININRKRIILVM